MKACICTQCETGGRTGSFLSSGKDTAGGWVPVSPVFGDLVELFRWMKVNGWKSAGYLDAVRG